MLVTSRSYYRPITQYSFKITAGNEASVKKNYSSNIEMTIINNKLFKYSTNTISCVQKCKFGSNRNVNNYSIVK